MKFSDLIESKIKSEGDFYQAKSIAMHVLAEFVNREDQELDVMDIDLGGGSFVIYSEDEAYSLTYSFDIDISEHSYFRSGTYDDPPESEPCMYNFENMKIEVEHATGNGIKTIYTGPDFTEFMKLPLSEDGKIKGMDLMYDTFDDEIQEMDREREIDYRGYSGED